LRGPIVFSKKRRSGDARKDDYYDPIMHNLKGFIQKRTDRESKEFVLPEDPLEAVNNLNGEPDILSFIIRVWKEDTGMLNPKQIWRGHITALPFGERQYFTDIDQIPALIADHLNKNR